MGKNRKEGFYKSISIIVMATMIITMIMPSWASANETETPAAISAQQAEPTTTTQPSATGEGSESGSEVPATNAPQEATEAQTDTDSNTQTEKGIKEEQKTQANTEDQSKADTAEHYLKVQGLNADIKAVNSENKPYFSAAIKNSNTEATVAKDSLKSIDQGVYNGQKNLNDIKAGTKYEISLQNYLDKKGDVKDGYELSYVQVGEYRVDANAIVSAGTEGVKLTSNMVDGIDGDEYVEVYIKDSYIAVGIIVNGNSTDISKDVAVNFVFSEAKTQDSDAAGEATEGNAQSNSNASAYSLKKSEKASDDQVRVIVENTTFTKEEGAPWEGTLVDRQVTLTEDSTAMSCIGDALVAAGVEQEGVESGYISSIGGLAAFDGGSESGWMGTLNDWFTNEGFAAFTVAAGTLKAGDVITVMYTSEGYGADIGCSWDNNIKTLNNVEFSKGILNKEFKPDEKEYILTLPEGTDGVVVTPTATNKNFQVRTSVDEKEYNRSAEVPVSDGTIIKVKCGDSSWPSMNNGYNGAENVPAEEYTFTVKIAKIEKAKLKSLIVHTSTAPSNSNVLLKNEGDSYTQGGTFDADKLEYTLETQNDSLTQLRFRAEPANSTDSVKVYYYNGSKDIKWSSGSSKWANCLQPGKNEVKIVVSPESGNAEASTTYILRIDCSPTLSEMTFKSGGASCYLTTNFSSATKDYTLTIPDDAEKLTVNATPKKETYKLTYNGSESKTVDVSAPATNKIEVEVMTDDSSGNVPDTYTINLNRVANKTCKFNITPDDAKVEVCDPKGEVIKADEDGNYKGLFGEADKYTYMVTKYGYISESGTIPAEGGNLDIVLEKDGGSNLEDVGSDWENFRNGETNMGITDAKTPISAEDTTLLWNAKLGSGWTASPSVQIIVDNSLIVMSGTMLYKLDLKTGEVLQSATMTAAPNFGYTPPTYAAGMIFCPLTGGRVQAFNAKTLESLWVYTDPLGGQSLSPITYSEGYIYTGFWNSETKDANYVCISITDEDTSKPDEAKLATWKHAQAGGFYWAGSVVVGKTVVVGSDDGTSGATGTAKIYSFDKQTGKTISSLDLQGTGDQRSSMAYDKDSGKVFFTTKGGYLCSAKVNASTGEITELKKVNYNAQSTSTPVVYKGKVYFATGSGITTTGSSGNMVVADAESLQMFYAVGLKGYPQCSLLLSTAYEAETGYIYLYSTYNANPGGISMIKIKPSATTASEAELIELYDAKGFEQYCITSIICGKDGTLYYKNDSGNVFAVGVPDYKQVINLIDKIGAVTLDSGSSIDTARKAYDALSDEDKEKISNYELLTVAETKYSQIKIENCNNLIEAIGAVTLKSEDAIKAARKAYDSLTVEEKGAINNYDKLVLAEKEFADLQAEQESKKPASGLATGTISGTTTVTRPGTAVLGSVTKSVNLTAKGDVKTAQTKIDAVLNPSDPTSKLPENFEELTGAQLKSIIEAYKEYNKLTDDQKLLVEDHEEFEAVLEKVGTVMHHDKKSGITAEGIEWRYKLVIKEQKFDKTQKEEISKALGEDAQILLSYDISFIDLLSGKEYKPEKSVTVKIPKPEGLDGFNTAVIVHINDDGKYEYIKCKIEGDFLVFAAQDFSPYGVAGINGMWSDVLKTQESRGNYVIWIIVAAIAFIAIAALTLFKKKYNRS